MMKDVIIFVSQKKMMIQFTMMFMFSTQKNKDLMDDETIFVSQKRKFVQ